MQAEYQPLPLWRSMLFVPGNSERFISSAHTRGADAIVLDLEDSVPQEHKVSARALVRNAISSVSRSGAEVMVRINASLRLAVPDLEATVVPGLRAIVVPKAGSACQLNRLSEAIAELESERGMPPGEVVMIAQIETLEALPELDAIAAVDRVVGMSLGSEDFSMAAGMIPSPANLMAPSQMLVFAARRHQCIPYGFVDSIANFSDLERFAQVIVQARHTGFCGAFCIHPNQVKIMNSGFLPTAQEMKQAQEIESAFTASVAQGVGALSVNGKMVDKPVVERALQQIALVRRFE